MAFIKQHPFWLPWLGGGLALLMGFLAGMAPCNASLIPLWIGYLLGNNRQQHTKRKWVLFTLSLGCIFGLLGSAVFVFKWLSYGLWYHPLLQVGLGLLILGIWFVQQEGLHRFVEARLPWLHRLEAPLLQGGKALQTLAEALPWGIQLPLLALAFAFLSSPCATPLLLSLTVLSHHASQPWQQVALFMAYGVGESLPLLLLGLLLPTLLRRAAFQSWLGWLQKLGGLLLLASAIWLIVDGVSLL